MTIKFPDVSYYTPCSLAGAPVVIARATIGMAKDSRYDSFRADAHNRGIPFTAYHFLNSSSLGHSPEEQADFAFSVIGKVPTMLDHEPNRGYCATLDESYRWIDRFRSRGGICHLDYLPHWVWANHLNNPDLGGLRSRDVHLVASHYTAYQEPWPADTSYGGSKAVQWQWTDFYPFNGVNVDFNAYLGTVAQYWDMATKGATMLLDDPQKGELANLFWLMNNIILPNGKQANLRAAFEEVFTELAALKTQIGNLPTGGLTDADRALLTAAITAVNDLNSRLASP
jgi:hypothetical protein